MANKKFALYFLLLLILIPLIRFGQIMKRIAYTKLKSL